MNERTERMAMAYERAPHRLFEFAVASSWALVGLSWLTQPASTAARSPVGRNVGDFATAWSVLYLVAFVLICIGLERAGRRRHFKIAGLILLAAGLAMHSVAALSFMDIEPRSFIYPVHGVACAVRALFLIRITPRR
jgi:cytochrome bd-type quinol oxidase subunit 2